MPWCNHHRFQPAVGGMYKKSFILYKKSFKMVGSRDDLIIFSEPLRGAQYHSECSLQPDEKKSTHMKEKMLRTRYTLRIP